MEIIHCPSINEWIKNVLDTHTKEYYSTTIKKEIMPFVATWIECEGIMLSEISQTERQILYDITNMWI